MKHQLQTVLFDAIKKSLPADDFLQSADQIQIEKTRDKQHGDYSANTAMVLAKQTKTNPREFAAEVISNISDHDFIERIEVAGPGFINFFLKQNIFHGIINEILDKKDTYGCSDYGMGQSVLLEFVSANPTGPLHIGHGRGAAFGEAVSNLLKASGFNVVKEYYVNDAGRQMDILTYSIWLRYLEINNIDFTFPVLAYQGEYIREIARELVTKKSGSLINAASKNVPEINDDSQLDAAITLLKSELGTNEYSDIQQLGITRILDDIRADLEEFGVTFDNWCSEKEILNSSLINECVQQLQAKETIYEAEGAKWFRSSAMGDEKDRVIIRENGQSTYFASDIAYHKSKFDRGYDRIIDIWGADHHGYIARVRASLEALDQDNEKLVILLVQFATLYRGKEKIQMSTRSGQYVTLRELREEIGNDAARFFYVTRKNEQHLDFDLELAKSESNENPVYYIQYAHARICSVFKQMEEKNMQFSPANINLDLLKEEKEAELLTRLAQYPEMIQLSAISYSPHQVCFYLRDLANDFHTYYNACQFLVDDENLRNTRLTLIYCVRQVINNGLSLLGVSAPESM